MARPKKRFAQLIEEIDRTPWGPQEQALVTEAVALATEIGDETLEYQARMRQTASANMAGATDLMLTSFAWCLAHHDADPARFPADLDNGGADLMWQFKWMASALRSSPAFAPEQIAAVLDDMESHYNAAGLGMSGVLTARFEDAWAAGRWEQAEQLRVQLEATPRDSHSHCDACVRSQSAGFFAATDRDADAVRLVEEMLEGGFSCAEEPEHALSVSLIPYLRQDRGDEAKAAHLRSYRLAKENPDNLATVANNIFFCAITGNEARALTLIERHLPWITHDALNVQAQFRMLTAIGASLDRVVEAGHGETPVRGAQAAELEQFFGAHEGAWSSAELAPVAWAAAARLGESFDRRDGSDNYAVLWEKARALATERYDVPIRSDAFVAPSPQNTPVDADGWYQRVLDFHAYGAENEVIEALPSALELADQEQRVVLQGIQIAALVAAGRTDDAEALLPARIAALRDAGRDDQADLEHDCGLGAYGRMLPEDIAELERRFADASALSAETRGSLALTLATARLRSDAEDAADQALDAAEHAHRALAEAGNRRLQHAASACAVMALLHKGEHDATLDLIAVSLAEPDLLDGARARLRETRARLRGGREEFAEGASDADETCRILARLGARQALAHAHVLAGALWEDAGDAASAVARYRFAARFFDRENPENSAAVSYRLGRAMLAAGDAAEAAEVLGDVLAREESAEVAASSRATTASLLARALAESGEFGQAFGVLGLAAELYAEAEQRPDQAMAQLERARLLARFGEQADALTLLQEAEGLVRAEPEALGALTEVLHTLAQAYGAQRDERAFALFDEVEGIARENDALWLAADVTDSRARALAELERTDEAVACALTAADEFSRLGDAGSAGGSELFAARLLTSSQRQADAVPVYRSVLDRAQDIPPLRQVAALELGDVLEGLGRTAEAAEARARAED